MKPPFGFTATGSEFTWANLPQPEQKKSPTGVSIAGASSPSQCARSTSRRQLSTCVVSQMCVMQPDPAMSASVAVSPGPISIDGDTFQP